MKRSHLGLLVFIATCSWLISALDATAQVGSGTVHVDPVNGVDTSEQSGSATAPLRTITYALAQLNDLNVLQPWTLRLKPGEYKAPSETFPIALHSGMQLLGEGAGAGVTITGVDNPNKNEALIYANGATSITISGIVFQEQDRTGGTNQGGALELIGVSGQISDCKFIGNSTRKAGGAIWASLVDGASLPLSNLEFTGNSAWWADDSLMAGGAIFISGDYAGNVTGCTFTGNKARNYSGSADGLPRAAGGALYVSGNVSGGLFTNNTFDENQAIPFSVAENNTSISSGGAIHIEGNAETAFVDCLFVENAAFGYSSEGGAIAVQGFLQSPADGGVTGCTFTDNSARRAGGALFVRRNLAAEIDSDFSGNKCYGAIDGTQVAGGAIFVGDDYTGIIGGSSFAGNLARNYDGSNDGIPRAAGGALHVGGNFFASQVTDCVFNDNQAVPFNEAENNTSISSGGAIHIVGNAETAFTECHFNRNAAYGYSSEGGAIAILGYLQSSEGSGFQGCEFNQNLARRAGGALYIGHHAVVDIDSDFVENEAYGAIDGTLIAGGAAYVAGDFTGDITGSDFSRNRSRNYDGSNDGLPRAAGGALYVLGGFDGGRFTDSTFSGNQSIPFNSMESLTSISSGGAIHIEGDAVTSFDTCDFVGNAAYGYYATGGAVTIGGDFHAIEGDGVLDCLFADNGTRGQGGAVFAARAWTGAIRGSDFIRNTGLGSGLEGAGASLGGAFAVSGGMDGDIAHNLFSDNAVLAYESSIESLGGAVGIGGTYQGTMEFNTFTANSSNGSRNVGSGGGAVAILGFAQQGSLIHNNLFSGNSAHQGGAVYFGASGGVKPRLFNNHFMYNQTPGHFAGGVAVFTRQNLLFYNNFVMGQSENAVGVAIQRETVGTEIWNSIFLRVHTGIHIAYSDIQNNIAIRHNDFFNFTDAVRLGDEGLGADLGSIGEAFNGRFSGNHTQSPLYYLQGDSDTPLQTGSWSPAAVYDPERDVTVFTDPLQSWTNGMWKNCMLNLSQDANNLNLRQHYLIVDNTRTQVMVRGNLVPKWVGVPSELNRGQLNTGYKIDNYHLSPRSYNLDRGAPVVVLVGSVETDITPTVDFEGDARPLNCSVDIGPDEALRSIPASLTLLGATEMCIQLGASYVEPGFSALSDTGDDLGSLVNLTGDVVNTSAVGTYRITYTLGLCSGEVFVRERVIEVSSEPCEGSTGPVANAGLDQTLPVAPGESVEVALDGTGSSGNELKYTWVGLDGAPDPADTPSPTVRLSEGAHIFQLTVEDANRETDVDRVTVTVREVIGSAPVAVVQRRVVRSLDHAARLPLIELDGSSSTDADGTITSYVWSGPSEAANPEDIARPILGLSPDSYTFVLTVTDNDGLTGTAQLVVDVMRPPLEEVRTLFREELAGADTNGNAQVSQSEAQAFVVFLTEAEFQELDTGSDGVLTVDELGKEGGTTGCSPGRGGKRGLAGDLLLLMGVLGSLAYSTLRRGTRRDIVLP